MRIFYPRKYPKAFRMWGGIARRSAKNVRIIHLLVASENAKVGRYIGRPIHTYIFGMPVRQPGSSHKSLSDFARMPNRNYRTRGLGSFARIEEVLAFRLSARVQRCDLDTTLTEI